MAKPGTRVFRPFGGEDDPTVPICLSCGEEAIHGGPIVPDRGFISTVGQCAFGDGWTWCETAKVFKVD